MAKKKTKAKAKAERSLNDDDPIAVVGRIEETNTRHVYYDVPYGLWVVLLVEGTKDGLGRFGVRKVFNTHQEAVSYLEGVKDATKAQDRTLTPVNSEKWFEAEEPELTEPADEEDEDDDAADE